MASIQQLTTFWVWPYFVALNIVGAWFIANLALVVIVTQFKATKRYVYTYASLASSTNRL